MTEARKLPTKDEFSTEINSRFVATVGDGAEVDLFLVEAKGLLSNEVQEVFSLLFRAPVESQPAQDLYRLVNENLGEMDLLLVPVKKDESGLYYEAVFNHLVAK